MDLELNVAIDASLEYFFSSLKGGNDSTTSFLRHWKSLNDTLSSHRSHLKAETLANAHTLASKISLITSGMLELDKFGDNMQHQLEKDFAHILNDDMENLVIRDESPITTDHGSTPAYVKPCSHWLLDNLHNPYPSKSIRSSICRQTGSSIKDLDAWFTDARKRIGWNQLRRTHFSNRREKIIDAATLFFKPSQKFLRINPFPRAFPLDQFKDHSMAFVEMEECARRLFSDKFEETPLARTINQAVEDHAILKRKRSVYPSPDCTPEHSPEPSSPSNIEVSYTLPSVTASHKRRRSTPEPCMDDTSPDRPQKRMRAKTPQSFDSALAAASLPSPAASSHEVSSPSGSDELLLASMSPSYAPIFSALGVVPGTSVMLPVASLKRKRASSDSDDRRPSKYMQPASSSRIASDPFPVPNQLLNMSLSQNLLPSHVLDQPLLLDTIPRVSKEAVTQPAPLDTNCYQASSNTFMSDNSLNVMPNFSLPSESDAWAEGLRDYALHDLMMAENSIYTNNLAPLMLEPDFFTGMPALEKFFDPTSSAIDWTGFLNQPLDTQITSQVELGMVFNEPDSVPTSTCPPTPTELAAKRQRAEILRAELRQLEADLD